MRRGEDWPLRGRGLLPARSAGAVLKRMLARLRCFVRRHHDPKRHPLGGFTCRECGTAGESLDEMGFLGGGYVPPQRRIYSREDGSITRTTRYESDRRGEW